MPFRHKVTDPHTGKMTISDPRTGEKTIVDPRELNTRIITNVPYMRRYGMRLKEPRQMLQSLPDLDTDWHDWKYEEYVHHGERSIKSSSSSGSEAANRPSAITPISRLSQELLIIILSFLPPLAQLSTRLSSPIFYHCVSGNGSRSSSSSKVQPLFSLIYTLRTHHHLKIRQQCRQICDSWLQQHRSNIRRGMTPRTLSCFACGTRYPRFFYSDEEAVKLSGCRVCPGCSGSARWAWGSMPFLVRVANGDYRGVIR